ncbi:MAG TPA: hypothetical protein VMT56_01910, partial [Candidatus Bathyarchaeia archaeon]|nr:hypothetical protein [Candidatus Bathyarchaeia archaeon]
MPGNEGKPVPTLFLCWSGQRSKQVAEALKQYFEAIFPTLDWGEPSPRIAMSETLIDKGAPWSTQLLQDLENARAGIVCLTPENRSSAWLHFEGGAIATHGVVNGHEAREKTKNADKLFAFLFTFDNTQIDGPLGLFQATIYRRDYSRDLDEVDRLTRAVLRRFDWRATAAGDGMLPWMVPLENLIGRLRELQGVAFREVLPALEGHARRIIQASDDLSCLAGRLQALSAMRSLQLLLEDRERQIELLTAASQQMFFERMVEALSAACRALEAAMLEPSGNVPQRVNDLVGRLRRMLEVAVEPLTPVLDDAWRYALYGLHGTRHEAHRKQKLLLVHPLESTLQRAELTAAPRKSAPEPSDEVVPPGHLLSRNEKRRALRSYWAWDRIAAYIHYCEDISLPENPGLETTLIDLTRAVLKEISLIEVLPDNTETRESDDLPLRFALRALVLKVKLAIGHGKYGPEDRPPLLTIAVVRELIDSRIKGETGLSFQGIEELITCLRKLNAKIGIRSSLDLKPPLLSL